MRIGDMEVDVLKDGRSVTPEKFFDPMHGSMHADMVHDGHVELPIACFLIRAGGMNILIDCGLGPTRVDWTPEPGQTLHLSGGALPLALKRKGLAPEDIDLVLPTHMHLDHAGWLVDDGKPFFPNARIRFGAGDWDGVVETMSTDEYKAGMYGLRAEGRVELIEADGEVAPGITAMATPGHSPGHTSFVLSSGDTRAIILGDIISCPLQIETPERELLADSDPELAIRTRDRILRELDGETLVGGPHFPELRFGRVLMGSGRRYWS